MPNAETIENAIREVVRIGVESNAGCAKVVITDKDDLPTAAIIFLNTNSVDMKEMLDAIERIEESWYT